MGRHQRGSFLEPTYDDRSICPRLLLVWITKGLLRARRRQGRKQPRLSLPLPSQLKSAMAYALASASLRRHLAPQYVTRFTKHTFRSYRRQASTALTSLRSTSSLWERKATTTQVPALTSLHTSKQLRPFSASTSNDNNNKTSIDSTQRLSYKEMYSLLQLKSYEVRACEERSEARRF